MGHERMEESQDTRENGVHDGEDRGLGGGIGAVQDGLCSLHKPVAVVAPEEVVEQSRHLVEAVALVGIPERGVHGVELREHVQCDVGEFMLGEIRRGIARALHLPEAAGIPELVGEVAALLDLLLIKLDVLALRGDTNDAEAETVGAVFCDQVERIG